MSVPQLGPIGLRVAFAVASVAVIVLVVLLVVLGYLFATRRTDRRYVQVRP